MGIYVYPSTKCPAILEKLAGVPHGTAEEHQRRSVVYRYTSGGVPYFWFPDSQKVEPWPIHNQREQSYREWKLLNSDPAVKRLHDFDQTGFGALRDQAAEILIEWGFTEEPEDGSTDLGGRKDVSHQGQVENLNQIVTLLKAQTGLPIVGQSVRKPYLILPGGSVAIEDLGYIFWLET